MANPRCKVCLSFNLPGSRVCSQCGSRLTGGARWPWLLGLVASLALCAGVLWSQRRMLGPPVETPLPAVPAATRPGATAPESHADEDRATPAEAEEPAPPALVRVTPFDADGLALSPAVSCAVADGKIALPMACVRGATSVDVDGVKVLAVQSYQDDVV